MLKATVTDAGGKTASDTVTITVYEENTPPTCGFVAPTAGTCFEADDTIVFEGTARDDQTAAELLSVSLESALDRVMDDALVVSSTGTWTHAATDCDDTDATVGLTATEVCDSQDNDCDGLVDDADPGLDTTTASSWYADADGYGDAATSALTCVAPSGYVSDSTGCDDAFAYTYPGATELCDGALNDCSDTTWTDDAGLVSWETAAGVWSDDTSTWAAGISALPASISLASEGTAHVCEGTWYVALEPSANVEVVGEDGMLDVVLSGGGNATVVNIQTDAITVGLSGLTIRDGEATETPARASASALYGGGVYCEAFSNLELTDTIVTENHAEHGGGLYADGCDVVATDTDWEANTADTSGAGVFAYDLTWIESGGAYTSNEAMSGAGARYLGSDVTLEEVTFDDNLANTGGAAAFQVGYVATLDATNVTVSSNASGTNASGGEHYGGAVWLYSETTATLTDVSFESNTSDNIAGALYAYDADIDCVGCTFDDNSAVGSGGALYIRTESEITLDDTSSFTGNHSDGSGGAIYNGIRTLYIDGTYFDGNSASSSGGAILSDASFVDLSGGSITGNSAAWGAGLYDYGSTGRISADDVTISGNDATSSGADAGAFLVASGTTLTLDTCVVDGNTAGDLGGAIWIAGIGAQAQLTDTDLTNNLSTYGGGVSLAYFGGYGSRVVTRGSITSNLDTTAGGGILTGGTVTANSVNMGGTNSPSDTEYSAYSGNWGTSASFTCTAGGGCL